MRLLISGSRNFTDRKRIQMLLLRTAPDVVIEGGQVTIVRRTRPNGETTEERTGADWLAHEEATALGIPVETYKAEWERYGRSAGPLRNQQMLAEGRPDHVAAFPLGGSKGTWDMVDRARAGSVPLEVLSVFVFGSNYAGRHGAGAAKEAAQRWKAAYGCGVGRTGYAYALPTKDADLRSLPLALIGDHARIFLTYAEMHPELHFYVTRVGCGLAGYKEEEVRPLFEGAPDNCEFTWLG